MVLVAQNHKQSEGGLVKRLADIMMKGGLQRSVSECVCLKGGTHKVNSTKAAMSDLSQVGEQLLWVIFAEEVGHVGVLQVARPNTRGHGQGLCGGGGYRGQCRFGGRSQEVMCLSTYPEIQLSVLMRVIFLGVDNLPNVSVNEATEQQVHSVQNKRQQNDDIHLE